MTVAAMITALVSALLLFSAQNVQPSFDCRHATTVVERAICADPELARLDQRMAARFSEL